MGDNYIENKDPINRANNNYGEDNPEYFKFSMIKLTRQILKISIIKKKLIMMIKNQMKIKMINFKTKKTNKKQTKNKQF